MSVTIGESSEILHFLNGLPESTISLSSVEEVFDIVLRGGRGISPSTAGGKEGCAKRDEDEEEDVEGICW